MAETEPVALSNLRPTGRRSFSSVTHPEPAVIKTKSNVSVNHISRAEPDGSPAGLGDASKIKRRGNNQFAALCFCLFLAGYNDGMSFLFQLRLVLYLQ
jgi:hypothetical protein